jgi:hypothetical protein
MRLFGIMLKEKEVAYFKAQRIYLERQENHRGRRHTFLDTSEVGLITISANG